MSKLSCHFYCIQPITVENDLLLNLFRRPINISSLPITKNYSKTLPPWLEEFAKIKSSYGAIRLIDQKNPIDIQLLIAELELSHKINGTFSLKPCLDTANADYYLFFDYRLAYFNIVYDLTFCFDVKQAKQAAEVTKGKKDFYNIVRNLMVKETDASILSSWANNIHANALLTVRELLHTFYKIKPDEDALSITNNTGNITNVICFNDCKANDRLSLTKSFIELNSFAERLENTVAPLVIDSENSKVIYSHDLYSFNGRFHTILLSSTKDQYRYIPIQFQVQYIWFYIIRLNSILETLNDEIIIQGSHKNLTEKEHLIDTLVSRVDILNLFHEGFKFAIEVDYERIYKKIECRWSLENSLTNTNQYISSFKDFLARLQAKKTIEIERRQNKILFFITILQFIALLSVWNDYLSLLDRDSLSKATEIVSLVGSVDMLAKVNFLLPIGFFSAIALMLIYIYTRNNKK